MIEYIIGEYQRKEKDVFLDEFRPINPNWSNQDLTFVFIAEDVKLSKEQIDFMKESKVKFKILSNDKSFIKGERKGKKLTVKGAQEDINPFELAKDMITMKDREYLLGFLMHNKPNLFVAVSHLACNVEKLCEVNKTNVMWLSQNLFKVQQELLYHFIAVYFKLEPGNIYLKWKYPKKEKAEKEN